MTTYVVVVPRYAATENRTVQGDKIVTIWFERTELIVNAFDVEKAMREAKKFPGITNPILEKLNPNEILR